MAEARTIAVARTIAEAYVHLELTLPEGEDWVDYRRYTMLHDLDDEHWLLRFDGPYQGQWYVATVLVSKAENDAAEKSGEWYGTGQSTLVDAGQWYAIESGNSGMAQLGLEELAGSPPDEQTYWAIVAALSNAAAATVEIEKFLPTGAEEVPTTAFWTTYGQRVRQRRRDAFRRTRLAGDRAFYQRRRDEIQRRFESLFDERVDPVSGPPEPTATAAAAAAAAAVPVEPGPAADPLPARTYGEVHAYLDLHPCPCGSVQFPRAQMTVLASDDREVLVEYAGPCDSCGLPREHRFRLPQRPGLPPGEPYRFSYLEDGPSTLLDAGEWVAVSQAYAAVADAVSATMAAEGDEPHPADHDGVVTMLTMAVTALDEVVKFLPPDAEEVPTSACWTANGEEVRRLTPHWFQREQLAERQALLRRQLDAFRARYGR